MRSANLTSGNIPKQLLQLTVPLMMGNILQQLYNTADAVILGHFAGDTEFAAVGIAGSVMNLFLFLITGVCSGISVLFAQFYGAGDRVSFRREHWLTLSFGTSAAIVCSVLGFCLLPLLLHLIQTPAQLTAPVKAYLLVILFSLPASFLYNLYGAMLRSIGQARAALSALAAAVIINLILDYSFVAGLQWGINGAAWATAISQAVSAGICILYLWKKAPELLFHREDCHMDRFLLQRTIRLGSVTGLHQSSLYIGKLLVQGAVNTCGIEIISAYTATTRIEGFANSFGDSGCAATSVLVAQNIGAKKEDRVRKSFQNSLLFMLCIGLIMSAIMFIFADMFVGWMLGTKSGESFENACKYIKLIAFFYVFCFTGNTFAGYFDGLSRVSIPFCGALGHITLRVILSYALVGKMGLSAVALATGIGWILANMFWAICKGHMANRLPQRTLSGNR